MKLIRVVGWVLFLAGAIAGLSGVDLGRSSDPAVVTVGVVRIAALAGAWYLLAATVVAVLAGAPRVRLVPGLVRWVVAGATLVPAVPAAASVPSPPPIMQPVDDLDGSGHAGDAPLVETVTRTERTWTVQPGDHLWRVAERTLADAWGRPATDAEVAPFWRQVVEANRPVLADPANPDLVFAGQQLVIPEPPAGPYVGRA